ncbi:hypothetical protein FSP39_024106 [Pinctada imbricata]|uniref:YHYH domain-containing protein n=1 Tax=Pinctada imbricata TaxID=66713 RepID=A0AA89BUA1_PINIB|nr:hypothetical protein FSP39_024106 [Pinctada imbricata]
MGIIGLTRTGVAIFNPLNSDRQNAVAGSGAETFDSCDGHADNRGTYHYHKIPDSCLYRGEVDEFIGVALDGFPIYGPRVSYQNSDLTSLDLDKCHDWESAEGHYLCECTNTGGGARPECNPRNPNRPADCPTPRPSPQPTTHVMTSRHASVSTTESTTSRTTNSPSNEGLTASEISKFGTTSLYGASVTISTSNTNFLISASGLPDHETQTFNNNYPTAQNYMVTIPQTPTHAAIPGCLSLGMIGITRTGVAIYNPLTGGLDNAVEGPTQEQFDSCDGHASPNGAYHYHKLPDSCLYRGEVDEFIGVALDGFPIYGPRISASQNISEDELDKCHGKFVNGRYRYYVTQGFPYFMGCFKGVVINQRTVTQYNCSSNVSPWNKDSFSHDFYLCHCATSGGGGGGGNTMGPRPECAPYSTNRPSDCPDCLGPNPPPNCPTRPTVSSTPSIITGVSTRHTSTKLPITHPSTVLSTSTSSESGQRGTGNIVGSIDTASLNCKSSILLLLLTVFFTCLIL